LLSESHLTQIFDFLDKLHELDGEIPTNEDIYSGYIDKLKKRFEILEDYPYPDAKYIQKKCIDSLEAYIPQGRAYIHGDLWFSNILVDSNNTIKVIDMKGQLNNKLTMGGDRLYDYGKLYQSVLGYDAVLYGDSISKEYNHTIQKIFIQNAEKRNICMKDLTNITISLMIGTLPFIKNESSKQNVWNFIKRLMASL